MSCLKRQKEGEAFLLRHCASGFLDFRSQSWREGSLKTGGKPVRLYYKASELYSTRVN